MQIGDSWLRDIPQQFQEKHNIEVLIKAFSKQMQEVLQVLEDLHTKLDIEVATGQNLDYIGTIVSLSRKEAGILAGVDMVEPVMSDERYRQFLKYKILKNTNEGTYYDLMNGISLLWDFRRMFYLEDPKYPATILFQTEKLELDKEELIEFYSKLCIHPSGVGVLLRKMWYGVIEEKVFAEIAQFLLQTDIYRKKYLFVDRDIESIFTGKGKIELDIKSTAGLLVEKDLWILDGSVPLNGSRLLDAEVYTVDIS